MRSDGCSGLLSPSGIEAQISRGLRAHRIFLDLTEGSHFLNEKNRDFSWGFQKSKTDFSLPLGSWTALVVVGMSVRVPMHVPCHCSVKSSGPSLT